MGILTQVCEIGVLVDVPEQQWEYRVVNPLALTDLQLNLIPRGASLLPPDGRGQFLRLIVSHLSDIAPPTGRDMEVGINCILYAPRRTQSGGK